MRPQITEIRLKNNVMIWLHEHNILESIPYGTAFVITR